MAIMACFLWSTAFVGIKLGLEHTTPLNFAGLRFILSGLFILPFVGNIKEYFKQYKKYFSYIFKISFFQTFLLYALFYKGIELVPAAIGAMIIGASPLFAAIMAHFLMKDDKISGQKVLAILGGIAGVAVIAFSRGEVSFGGQSEFLGVLILVLANFTGNYGGILVAQNKKPVHPVMLSSQQLLTGGIMLFMLSFFVEPVTNYLQAPVDYYLALLWLAFLSAAAFSLWFTLLQRPKTKVSEVNMWKFIIPVSGAVLSWAIIPAESPDVFSLIGMLIITLSLVFLYYKPIKQILLKKFGG